MIVPTGSKMELDGCESLTSESTSTCSESGDETESVSDTTSCRSLAFRVNRGRNTATFKSKKSKKRVRFKPGDSLVLIYVIPNREMLGLKSASEDSDSEYEDSDDEDEDDDNENDEDDKEESEEDIEEDDDDDDDEEEEEDDEEDDDDDEKSDNEKKDKREKKNPKPFAKLIAVKQVNRHKTPPELRSSLKKPTEKVKPITADTNVQSHKGKKRNKRLLKREMRDKDKTTKKDNSLTLPEIIVSNKPRQKKNRNSVVKTETGRPRHRKKGVRLIEIRATVESERGPKSPRKADLKPSNTDANSAITGVSKPLTSRTRLQPTSFKITKSETRPSSGVAKLANEVPVKPRSVAHVVSASYDSLTSVLPSSYIQLTSSLRKNGLIEEESIKRLDPEDMTEASKRNYGWQIANGTISSQSLRTPSILPFLDG